MEPENTSGQSSGEGQRSGWGSQKKAAASQRSGGWSETVDYGAAGKRQKVSVAHQNVFVAFPDDFDLKDLS